MKKRSRERATAIVTVWTNGRTNEQTNERRKREGLLILGERVKGRVEPLCSSFPLFSPVAGQNSRRPPGTGPPGRKLFKVPAFSI